MVVSNQNVKGPANAVHGWERMLGTLHLWLVVGPSRSLHSLVRHIASHLAQRSRAQLYDGIIRYVSIPQRQPDYLLERSDLLFRRENQEESFDDDVSALRDQVSSGRRDQSDETPYPDADPTTYSPPRQSWNTTSSAPTTPSYAATSEPPARAMPETGDASVIAQDTTWDGTVTSSGSIHVYGNVGGQITAEGDVYVAEGASVSATVHAGSMTIAGSIEGSIECSGRFEVLPTGRVTADVAAPRLVVHEGAVVMGNLRMTTE